MSLRPGVVNFDEKWRDLSQTINAVIRLKPVKRITWNDNISDIYALCVAFPKSFAETLYEQTQILLQNIVTELYKEFLLLDLQSLLSQYHIHWLSYRQAAHYLDNLFSYFNRVHLNKYRPVDSLDYHVPGITLVPVSPVDPNAPVEIRNMALNVWRTKMIDALPDRLFASLIAEISRDREGRDCNLGAVHDVIHSFIEVAEYDKENQLEYYQQTFEEPFLLETGEFYRQKAAHLVTDLSYSEFMKKAVSLLQSARISAEKFLHQSSMIKFIRECEARLVTDQLNYLQTYISHMVQSEQLTDLSNLFILFNGISRALEPVVSEFRNKVRNEGLGHIKSLLSSKQPVEVVEFINIVLRIHKKYKKLVQNIFGGHKSFLVALDEGCKGFVNYSESPQHQCQSPRLLSRYCDQLLKKGFKGLTDGELEEKLDDAIIVFQYIEDKDTFQKFYSRMLSRRLVHNNFVSMETEESMIQKLKHVSGYEYTARLQRMLMDITLSNNLVLEFTDLVKARHEILNIGFSTLILQSGAWQLPQFHCPNIILPDELIGLMTKFELFYNTKHCGRCLSWLHHLATGELKIMYLKKPYVITMTTFQMLVMLLFDTNVPLTLSSLQSWSQLEMKELKITLQSLVDAKLLIKHTSDESLEDNNSTQFSLNLNYSNKRTKFKVSALLQRETQQDIEQTQQMVLEDRKMLIQAALVRVMKHRKTLKHNQLIEEKCIEALIDKQYIERSSDSKDTYHYIA